MKKFLFSFLLMATVMAASAQSAILLPLIAGDTIVNTGTSSRTIHITGGYSGIAIQVLLNKISGTGAGTVAVLGSHDNTNFTAIGSAFTITNVTTQSTMFYITAPLPAYVKILATGSGTESVQQRIYYRLPKYNNQ